MSDQAITMINRKKRRPPQTIECGGEAPTLPAALAAMSYDLRDALATFDDVSITCEAMASGGMLFRLPAYKHRGGDP